MSILYRFTFFNDSEKTRWLSRRLAWTPGNWLQKNAGFFLSYFFPRPANLRSRSVFEPFSMRLSGLRLLTGIGCRAGQLFLLDCFYEISTNLLKRESRPLTGREIQIGKQVFGDSIRWDLVMIDEKAATTKSKKYVRAYVSFNTINYHGTPDDETLIHEFVHVWQYQQFGAVYIAKALAAQKTSESYDYTFHENWRSAGSLLDFNAEQQGEIAVDYYRLLNGLAPVYRRASKEDFFIFEKWVDKIWNRKSRL